MFARLMRQLAKVYGKKRNIKWKWQAIDSKSCPAPFGGEGAGRNPTNRGKQGSKVHLLVDKRGAPLGVVITGQTAMIKPPQLTSSYLWSSSVLTKSNTCVLTRLMTQPTFANLLPLRVTPRTLNPTLETASSKKCLIPEDWLKQLTPPADGSLSARSPGSPNLAAFVPAGPRKPPTGWPSFSSPVPTSSSIWRFSDRV